MSATNHTTNYNLPQFVGTDKPAWLGDINPAFSTIDTKIKEAKTAGDQGISDASTAKNRADSAYTLADDANTAAGTAQTTANTAIGNAQNVATALNSFESKFNLTNVSTGTTSGTTGIVLNNLKLAQCSDGSIFKFYGMFQINPSSSAPRSAIAGMVGKYGVDTGLVLLSAPDEAYTVNAGGYTYDNDGSGNTKAFGGEDFVVGTNGHIYIFVDDSSSAVTSYISSGSNATVKRGWYVPAVYFNASFGDTPTPDNA
jgi:hypothetical protein